MSILVAITIPLTELSGAKYNSITILILAGNWLLEGNYLEKIRRIRENKIVWIFISLFLFNLLGLLYSSNFLIGFRYVELNLSLIAMPLIYVSSPSLTNKQCNSIFLAFSASVILCSLYVFKDGFVYTFGDWYNPHHVVIQKREIIGRVYASIYLTLILFILYIQFFSVKKVYTYGNLFILLLTAYIIYLNGILIVKTTILSTFIITFLLLTIYLIRIRKWGYLLSFISLFLISLTVLFYSSPRISDSINKIIHAQSIEVKGSGVSFEMNSFSTRLTIWGAAMEILSEDNNWLLGVGTGDVKEELKKKYVQRGLDDNLYLDVHNEYLQTWLRTGIFGLIILLSCLIIPFIMALKANDYLYMSFLLLVFFCLFTESWFGRQAGVVFYAFFNSLFAFSARET